MNCPRCGKENELSPKRFWDVDIDYCPSCNGIWLDAKEMDQLMAHFDNADDFIEWVRSKTSPPKNQSAVHGRCPRDGKVLLPCQLSCIEDISPTTLDICQKCFGIWIDGPELVDVHSILLANIKAKAQTRVEVVVDQPFWRNMFVPSFLLKLFRRR